MKNTQMALATINAQADLLARALDNGYMRIYAGAQPATADTAVTSQTLLAELRFAATSAPAAVNGVLTFAALVAAVAAASGTAAWFRCLAADGSTPVLDGSVGLAGDDPNLVLNSVTIAAGGSVAVTSYTHALPRALSGL